MIIITLINHSASIYLPGFEVLFCYKSVINFFMVYTQLSQVLHFGNNISIFC